MCRGIFYENYHKVKFLLEAFERVQTVAIEKIEESENTRESIKFLSYLEAAVDKISINLDELKATMYLELCDRLKNLASQERDYFTEKKIPNLAGQFQNVKLYSIRIGHFSSILSIFF